jgi:hypothetical protein
MRVRLERSRERPRRSSMGRSARVIRIIIIIKGVIKAIFLLSH